MKCTYQGQALRPPPSSAQRYEKSEKETQDSHRGEVPAAQTAALHLRRKLSREEEAEVSGDGSQSGLRGGQCGGAAAAAEVLLEDGRRVR